MGRNKRTLSTSARRRKLSNPVRASAPGRSKRIVSVVLAGLIIATGAAGLTAWTRTTPLFQLSGIDVGGNRAITSQLALQMVPIDEGTNIFAIDLEAMEEVLERDPRIRNVTIRRHLPSRIVITIQEREPVLLLSADQLYGVDEENMVIPLGLEEDLNIPVLTGIFPEIQPGPGSHYLGIRKGLEIRQTVLGVAPSLLDKISEINVTHPEAVVLYLVQGGTQVRLGPGDLRTQLRRLWIVLSDLAAKGMSVECLDLRFKDQIVCQTTS
jgi:cell division protein FtsQ